MADAHNPRDFMLIYYLMLYSIFYYDCIITLPREYRLIWKAKWSAVKVLFFVNRYGMILESILILVGFTLSWSQDKCERRFIPWQTFLPVVVSGAGGILLILRTHAIWGRKRWVLYVLCPLFVAQIITGAALAGTQVGALPFAGNKGPCMTYARNKLMDLYCAMPILFDLVTSSLCIYRGYRLARELDGFTSQLLQAFTRHGTYYAIGSTLANVANLAFMTIATKHLGFAAVPSNGGMLCTVFSSILISRLAMSLKKEPAAPASPLLPSIIKSFCNSPYTPQTTFSSFAPIRAPARPVMSKSRSSQISDTTIVEIELVESPIPDSATPLQATQAKYQL